MHLAKLKPREKCIRGMIFRKNNFFDSLEVVTLTSYLSLQSIIQKRIFFREITEAKAI